MAGWFAVDPWCQLESWTDALRKRLFVGCSILFFESLSVWGDDRSVNPVRMLPQRVPTSLRVRVLNS